MDRNNERFSYVVRAAAVADVVQAAVKTVSDVALCDTRRVRVRQRENEAVVTIRIAVRQGKSVRTAALQVQQAAVRALQSLPTATRWTVQVKVEDLFPEAAG